METCLKKESGLCYWQMKGGDKGDIVDRLRWHLANGTANHVWVHLLTDALAEIESLRGYREGVFAYLVSKNASWDPSLEGVKNSAIAEDQK